jgi:hydrogenase maturation protease
VSEAEAGRSLVLCVGNDLVADDAAGCHVYERLQGSVLPPGTRVELLGLGGLSVLDHLEGEENLVLVDAVSLGAPVGTVHVLAWEDLPCDYATPVSLHGIGLREAIEVGKRLTPGAMPHRVLLVGIEGRCFDLVGHPPTPEVAAAIGPAADKVLRCLRQLNGGDIPGARTSRPQAEQRTPRTGKAQGAP